MLTHIKNILLIVVILYIIGYICNLYEKIFDKLSLNVLSIANINPMLFYFITPIFFWLASKSFLFKNANGPLMSHIKSLFFNLDKPDLFKKVVPFTSLVALVISSLLAVCAGGGLGSEAVIVNISMILLLFASDFFKNTITKINIENLLYIGYVFAFTIAFRTPISSLILAVEKSVASNSVNIFTNILYACLAIGIAMIFMQDHDKIFPNATPQAYDFTFSSIFKYIILAVICGIISSIFFKITYKVYFDVKDLVLNNTIMFNIIPILLGLCLAFIINTTGNASLTSGKIDINEMFNKHYIYDYKIQ